MYLGIDIGTSGVKSVLIDDGQNIIATAHHSINVSRPHNGWSEQNPEDWIKATKATLDTIKQSHGKQMSAVIGIGLSGQMHGATLLGKDDEILRPCMLWNDTRSNIEAKSLDANPDFQKTIWQYRFPRIYRA